MPEVHRAAAACSANDAAGGGRRPDWRAPLLLGYVVVGAALIVTSAEPLASALTRLLAGPDPTELAFEGCARLAVGIAISVLALAGMLLSGVRPPAGLGPWRLTGAAFPAGFVAVSIALAGGWAAGVAGLRPGGGVVDGEAFLLGTLVILLCVVAEEMLLRGLLQPALVGAWGARVGVPLCALAFAAIHMVGGWGHPFSLLNILLAGIWFGLLALRSGGLAAPILAHLGYNWTEEMLFGASPNPGAGAFGSVIDVDLTGEAIWGGSVEGLNASLAVSLVLAALILPLVRRPVKRIQSGEATARS
ncbi:MAG: type II CAAX endopeptidase family protein [Sphingomonas sp.]